MERAVAAGKVRSIGLSNFNEALFDEIISFLKRGASTHENSALCAERRCKMKSLQSKRRTIVISRSGSETTVSMALTEKKPS